MSLNISITGKLVDYGNLGWGRGIQIEVEGEVVSVTDLTDGEIESVKPFMGREIRLSISDKAHSGVDALNDIQLAEYRRWGDEDRTMSVDSRHFTRLVDEIERLREEDRQWDKHSLVEIIRERDRLRAGLRSVIDSMARGGVAYQVAVKALHGESAT